MIFLRPQSRGGKFNSGYAVLAGLFFMAAGLCACAGGSWGRLEQDFDVTRMFLENSVPGQFRYYICGRETMPYAITGLNPAYELDLHLWQEVEPNTEKFSRQVAFVWDPHVWDKFDPARGSWILDPEGNRIGIWYSMYPRAAIRVYKNEQQVVIYCPYRISEDSY